MCVQPLVCQRRSLIQSWNATSPQGTGQACVAVSNPPHPEAAPCCGWAAASRPRPLPRWLCQQGPRVSLLKAGSLRPSMDTCSPCAARGISVTPVSVPKLSRSECLGVSVARTMEPPCGDCGRTQRGTAARGAGRATEPRSPCLTHAWSGSSSSAMYGSVLRSSAARGRAHHAPFSRGHTGGVTTAGCCSQSHQHVWPQHGARVPPCGRWRDSPSRWEAPGGPSLLASHW